MTESHSNPKMKKRVVRRRVVKRDNKDASRHTVLSALFAGVKAGTPSSKMRETMRKILDDDGFWHVLGLVEGTAQQLIDLGFERWEL